MVEVYGFATWSDRNQLTNGVLLKKAKTVAEMDTAINNKGYIAFFYKVDGRWCHRDLAIQALQVAA